MTESEYELWFEENLSEIESPHDYDIKSPLSNAPKPIKTHIWVRLISVIFVASLLASIVLAFLYSSCDNWFYTWLSNALLNLSIGLIASLILMYFTEAKSRNITYYTDIIPILKARYSKMHKAYFEYTFKLDTYYFHKEFDKFYDAWHVHSNTCFVILNFFDYLLQVLPFTPKSIKFDREILSKLRSNWLDIHNQLQKNYFGNKKITESDYENSKKLSAQGFKLLNTLEFLINELEQDLFIIKYNKKWLTEEEKSDLVRKQKK